MLLFRITYLQLIKFTPFFFCTEGYFDIFLKCFSFNFIFSVSYHVHNIQNSNYYYCINFLKIAYTKPLKNSQTFNIVIYNPHYQCTFFFKIDIKFQTYRFLPNT